MARWKTIRCFDKKIKVLMDQNRLVLYVNVYNIILILYNKDTYRPVAVAGRSAIQNIIINIALTKIRI